MSVESLDIPAPDEKLHTCQFTSWQMVRIAIALGYYAREKQEEAHHFKGYHSMSYMVEACVKEAQESLALQKIVMNMLDAEKAA